MTANAGDPELDHLIDARHVPGEEPLFYLRARDPAASSAVRAWAYCARVLGVPIPLIERALIHADRMDAWPHKRLPDDERIPEAERKQLTYQHSRRAWRAQESGEQPLAIILAETRGWNAAMAHIRAGRAALDAEQLSSEDLVAPATGAAA